MTTLSDQEWSDLMTKLEITAGAEGYMIADSADGKLQLLTHQRGKWVTVGNPMPEPTMIRFCKCLAGTA